MFDLSFEFIIDLINTGICLILIYLFQRYFLVMLKSITKNGWFFNNKQDLIGSKRCSIYINFKKLQYNDLFYGRDTLELIFRNDKLNISIYNKNLEENEKIQNTLNFNLKLKEVPFLFSLKLTYLIALYKLIPKSIETGSININPTKSMALLIDDKISSFNSIKHNLKRS